MAQLLEVLTTDPRVRGSSPLPDQTFTQSVESRQLSVTRLRNHEVWSHREEGPGHCSISIASQCPKTTFGC